MVDFHEELHVLLGGALSASECELIFAPDATRPLATSILQSLHEGRLSVVSEEDLSTYEQTSAEMRGILLALPDAPARGAGQPEVKGIGAEGLERQVAELERALSVTAEQLAQAKHRNERMALLEPASSKEVASLAAYDRQMRNAISDELEVCTAAELECIDAIACIDSASIDLLVRLDPSGPFLLPLSRVTELSNANSEFLDAVQALMDGGGKCADADGVAGMRQVAMQELHRLQDLFVNNELDRTDALQMKEEALAMEGVAQAQLAELANSGSIRAQEHKDGRATVEERVVAKRNDITSLTKQAEKLRKDSESALLLELKSSQALPIKEGDYVLRLAEKETELERVRDANIALQEHKLRMQVFETFVADELMGHRQRASAISASVSLLNEMAESAPLSAEGAANSASPATESAESVHADAEALRLLQHLLLRSSHANTCAEGAGRASTQGALNAAFACAADSEASAAHLAHVVGSELSSVRNRRDVERDDVVHALLALEQKHAAQMRQCREMLWSNAADLRPISTPPPLAEAIATLQDVRRELEQRLQRIQHLRVTAPPPHAHAFVDFFLHPERMANY